MSETRDFDEAYARLVTATRALAGYGRDWMDTPAAERNGEGVRYDDAVRVYQQQELNMLSFGQTGEDAVRKAWEAAAPPSTTSKGLDQVVHMLATNIPAAPNPLHGLNPGFQAGVPQMTMDELREMIAPTVRAGPRTSMPDPRDMGRNIPRTSEVPAAGAREQAWAAPRAQADQPARDVPTPPTAGLTL